MQWKGMAHLALASFIVAGCSVQGSAETQETIVINEDVQMESSLADSSLEVSRQPDIEIDRDIDFAKSFGKVNDEGVYFHEKGTLYLFNLETGEEQKLGELEAIEISDDGNWAMSYEEGDMYIHHLKNGDKQLLENSSPEDVTFMGNAIAHFDYLTEQLSLIDMEKGETATWDLSNYPDATISSLKKAGDDVYLAVRSEEEEIGIWQLESQGKVALVANLTGKDTNVSEFDRLQNGSVIFNGTYDGKTGVFYWDEQTNDVQQLVAGGKSKEGIWTPFYNLSPDESKILFDTPVQMEDDFKTNVYLAELVDGQLNNSVRIMENANMYAVISHASDWSEDSGTVYITTSKDEHTYLGNIAVFKISE